MNLPRFLPGSSAIRALLRSALGLAVLLAASACAQDGGAGFEGLELELVAEGFTSPVALTSPADDPRLFVADQVGQIWILDENGQRLEEPFLDLSGRMVELSERYDERGLLGLAFHPAYAENGRFFVYYSAPLREGAPGEWDHTSHVSEFRVSQDDPNRADPDSERVVMGIDEPQGNHNGGAVAFGPDGYLYIALGDGGAANDVGTGHPPLGNGQDVTTPLGSLLRIDVDGQEEQGYAVPDDNPLVGRQLPDGPDFAGDAPIEEIYAWGFRNPFRFSFDRETGDLWVGDVGQNLFEEVHLVQEPGNYGWNRLEGTHPFDPDAPDTVPDEAPQSGPLDEELLLPVLEYAHPGVQADVESRGTTVIGGYVYRGAAIPELQGAYVFGDWSGGEGGKLFVATQADGGWSFAHDRTIEHFVLGFGEDSAGELYVLTTDNAGPNGETGRVYRLVAGGAQGN